MRTSVDQPSLPTPILLTDVPVRMAKVGVLKADESLYAALGACLAEVQRTFGLSLKEFSCELGKDERQIARQIDGTDRPQLEVVFAVERFRPALVIALARLAQGMEIDMVVTWRRSA